MNVQPIQLTYLNESRMPVRADLKKGNFDKLVIEKGRQVILEQAIKCPCKSASTNNLSNCKNCYGTGWVFVNPKETRMLLTGIGAITKNDGWSEELRGMVNVTALVEDEVSDMDRITAVDAESIYCESLPVKKAGSSLFLYTAYNMKSIQYIAMFDGGANKLKQLTPNVDYIATGKTIKFNASYLSKNLQDLSIAIRYKYAPTYHVIEMKRETMQSYKLELDGEKLQDFPTSAYARRAHYQLGASLNLTGNEMINNDFALPEYVLPTP